MFLCKALAFESVLLKHLNGLGHLADLVVATPAGEFDVELATRQSPHDLGDRIDRPDHPLSHDPKPRKTYGKAQHEQQTVENQAADRIGFIQYRLPFGNHHCGVGNRHKEIQREVGALDQLLAGDGWWLPGRERDV